MARREEDGRQATLAELARLCEAVDDEGLDFLLSQARVLAAPRTEERAEILIREGSTKGSKRGKAAEAASPEPTRNEFVQGSMGGAWHWMYGNGDKIFAAEEANALAGFAFRAVDEAAAAKAIYGWLDRERRDALADFGITGPASPAIAGLVKLLRGRLAKGTKG